MTLVDYERRVMNNFIHMKRRDNISLWVIISIPVYNFIHCRQVRFQSALLLKASVLLRNTHLSRHISIIIFPSLFYLLTFSSILVKLIVLLLIILSYTLAQMALSDMRRSSVRHRDGSVVCFFAPRMTRAWKL